MCNVAAIFVKGYDSVVNCSFQRICVVNAVTSDFTCGIYISIVALYMY